jgi:signal transduction histidine kinase
MTTEHLHFSTAMLRRLGEELNPHADQGILELVRNAYDADARECTVELLDTQQPGGTIRVTDDGTGMDLDAIRQGWLVLGSSGKVRISQTKARRFPIGNKGIGRLAAIRMGKIASLITRPATGPKSEHRLILDWSDFEKAKVVDAVPLEIKTVGRRAGTPDGTVVEIARLHKPLATTDVKRLARALILLSDPFKGEEAAQSEFDFKPVLKAPEFKQLEQLVAHGYLDEADYHLRADLTGDGKAKAIVTDYSGQEIFRGNHEDISSSKGHPRYSAPPAHFDLWWFLLRGGKFSPRSVTLTEVRAWLAEFGGVHLYHRGMRVSPYSDLDWLDMNLRRVRSPEHRPSTNNAIGRMCVPDETGHLQQKTDRVGFVEDAFFQDMRQFAIDVLEWLADRMLRRRDEKRRNQKEKAAKKVRQAKKRLETIIDSVPPAEKQAAQEAIEEYEKAKQRETNTLREDLQLYRTLGTVGTTAAAFAHQAKAPLVNITSSANTLEEALIDTKLSQSRALIKLAQGIKGNAESLLAFAKVTLGLLQHEKRRRGNVSVHASVRDTITLLEPYIALRQVKVSQELCAEQDTVLASRAAIESVVTNLLINALKAFEQRKPGERLVVVRTRNVSDRREKGRRLIQLSVLDNGPGISGLGIQDIWLPGKTTATEGTGLGLTIVRDVAAELGGKVAAVAAGELGGAELLIHFPVRAES